MAEPVRQAETPFKVVIVGAGRVGSALALLLKQAAEFEVVVVDPTEPAQRRMDELGLPLVEADPADVLQEDPGFYVWLGSLDTHAIAME